MLLSFSLSLFILISYGLEGEKYRNKGTKFPETLWLPIFEGGFIKILICVNGYETLVI